MADRLGDAWKAARRIEGEVTAGLQGVTNRTGFSVEPAWGMDFNNRQGAGQLVVHDYGAREVPEHVRMQVCALRARWQNSQVAYWAVVAEEVGRRGR